MAPSHPFDSMSEAQEWRERTLQVERQVDHLRHALTEIRWTSHEKAVMEYAKQALAEMPA